MLWVTLVILWLIPLSYDKGIPSARVSVRLSFILEGRKNPASPAPSSLDQLGTEMKLQLANQM